MQKATGLQVGEYIFEEVNDNKYFGTNLNNTNNNHEEIKNTSHQGTNISTPSQGYWGRSYCPIN